MQTPKDRLLTPFEQEDVVIGSCIGVSKASCGKNCKVNVCKSIGCDIRWWKYDFGASPTVIASSYKEPNLIVRLKYGKCKN